MSSGASTFESLINPVALGMLASLRKSCDETGRKAIDKAARGFGASAGSDLSEFNLPALVMAEPGMGKLALFGAAGAAVAQALGLRLAINPEEGEPAGPGDLALITVEAPSTLRYFNHLSSPPMEQIIQRVQERASGAFAALVVLDDIDLTRETAQKAAVDAAPFNRFGGLIGLTCSAGALEGNDPRVGQAVAAKTRPLEIKEYKPELLVSLAARRAASKAAQSSAPPGPTA